MAATFDASLLGATARRWSRRSIRRDALPSRAPSTLLTDKGFRSRKLDVSHAFHSRLMQPIVKDFE
jgi:hypothetical protein